MTREPVLFCYDGSPGAEDAIAAAGRLLQRGPALALYVWQPLSHVLLWNPLIESPGPLAEPAAELDAAGRQAAERLAADGAALARRHGFDAQPCIRPTAHGVWRVIVACAADMRPRAIVLGSHGTTPVTGMLGSVASGVVHHAHCPVLVIPGERGR